MRTLPLFLLLSLLLVAGCATGGTSSGASGSGPNVITEADLSGFSGISAYEAIERIRGQWLRGRSGSLSDPDGRNYPRVFWDGRFWGELDSLHQIDILLVGEIRFISAADATTRYGTGYPAGIIEVSTKK